MPDEGVPCGSETLHYTALQCDLSLIKDCLDAIDDIQCAGEYVHIV